MEDESTSRTSGADVPPASDDGVVNSDVLSYAPAFESSINNLLSALLNAADAPIGSDKIAHSIAEVISRAKTIERYLIDVEAAERATDNDGNITQLKAEVARGEVLIDRSTEIIERYAQQYSAICNETHSQTQMT